jgi:hypothetical protein
MTKLNEMLNDLRVLGEAKRTGIPGTVENFIMVMSSKLTQYDQRLSKGEMKRGGMPNIYRLGHFFKALDHVKTDTRSIAKSDKQADLEKLMASLGRRFTDFPPRRAVLKQIDQFIATGKKPSLVRK